MDVIMLSRLQFFFTTVVHYFFVPLTIGLALFIAVFQTLAYVKKDPKFDQLAQFFGKLFIINFAVGVVTGIVQEFQFGMNWAGYSRFVGDIFGAPLAIEALVAFFLESTFFGVWLFGRNRLPAAIHALSIWLVAGASCLSAFWILVANSFMQNPSGFEVINGRAQMVDFLAVIANAHVFTQFAHTVSSAILTAAFFVIGVSAYKLLKKHHPELFARSLKIGLAVSLVFVMVVALTGDLQGKLLMTQQPMKMAAAEALWDSEEPAAFTVVALIDEENQENHFSIEIPYMLSFLAFGDFNSRVEGIKELQAEFEQDHGAGNYIPPVQISFWSFRVMIGVAGLMVFISLIGVLQWKKKKLTESPRVLKLLLLALFLPYFSNTAGWILTEVGRQPWLVYKLLTLEQGISENVSAGWVLFSLIGFVLIYALLLAADAIFMVRAAKRELGEVAK